jgi:MATE family multidrug resistance protein
MFMGVVDTVMVGRLSPEAIGAVGMSSTIFLALGIFGMGLLLGLDTLVSQAFGAGQLQECHQWLYHGVSLALLATPAIILGTYVLAETMSGWGMHPAVRDLAVPYLEIVAWSALPLLLYAAFRRYLQALHLVRPVMFAVVSANGINVGANWLLIYGNLGFPALGTDGAAWATVISRMYIAAMLGIVIMRRGRASGLVATPPRVQADGLRQLLGLGVPAATQLLAEVGVFAVVTTLAARLDPIALASHQIALNVASVSFMVPLGVASVGAVRVGHAIGRRDTAGATLSGWTAIALGVTFMAAAAVTFVTVPQALVRVFTIDRAVIATGASLLLIAAAFQLFDGLQAVATGVLRGLGDTRTPMLSNLVGHWLLGLPISYVLCFKVGWGVVGLWIGLSLGLTAVALVLLASWSAQIASLRRAGP